MHRTLHRRREPLKANLGVCAQTWIRALYSPASSAASSSISYPLPAPAPAGAACQTSPADTPNSAKELAYALRTMAEERRKASEAPVQACIQECISQIDGFTPKYLSRVMVACARLRVREPSVLQSFVVGAASKLQCSPETFNEQDISNIANALVRLRCRGDEFFIRLTAFLENHESLDEFFKMQGLANTLNAYASLEHGSHLSPKLEAVLTDVATAQVELATAPQLANTLNSFARLQLQDVFKRERRDRWHRAASRNMMNFNLQGLANMLNAYAHLNEADSAVINQISSRLSNLAPSEYSEQDVANILHALSRLGFDDVPILRVLEDEGVLGRVLRAFTPQGLASATLALSRLSRVGPALTSLAEEFRRRTSPLHGTWEEPFHLVNAMFAITVVGPRAQGGIPNHHGFLSALIGALLRSVKERSTFKRLSTEAVMQLYAVLCDCVLEGRHRNYGAHCQGLDSVLPTLPLRGGLRGYAAALDLCDVGALPEACLMRQNDSSKLHLEVFEYVGPLCSTEAFVVNEALVIPYTIDIVIMNK